MAEPLSIAASVIAVVTLAGTVSKSLHDIASSIGSAAIEIRQYADEIESFSRLLQNIRRELGKRGRKRKGQTKELVESLVDICQKVLEPFNSMQRLLKPYIKRFRHSKSTLDQFFQRMQWWFHSKGKFLFYYESLKAYRALLAPTISILALQSNQVLSERKKLNADLNLSNDEVKATLDRIEKHVALRIDWNPQKPELPAIGEIPSFPTAETNGITIHKSSASSTHDSHLARPEMRSPAWQIPEPTDKEVALTVDRVARKLELDDAIDDAEQELRQDITRVANEIIRLGDSALRESAKDDKYEDESDLSSYKSAASDLEPPMDIFEDSVKFNGRDSDSDVPRASRVKTKKSRARETANVNSQRSRSHKERNTERNGGKTGASRARNFSSNPAQEHWGGYWAQPYYRENPQRYGRGHLPYGMGPYPPYYSWPQQGWPPAPQMGTTSPAPAPPPPNTEDHRLANLEACILREAKERADRDAAKVLAEKEMNEHKAEQAENARIAKLEHLLISEREARIQKEMDKREAAEAAAQASIESNKQDKDGQIKKLQELVESQMLEQKRRDEAAQAQDRANKERAQLIDIQESYRKTSAAENRYEVLVASHSAKVKAEEEALSQINSAQAVFKEALAEIRAENASLRKENEVRERVGWDVLRLKLSDEAEETALARLQKTQESFNATLATVKAENEALRKEKQARDNAEWRAVRMEVADLRKEKLEREARQRTRRRYVKRQRIEDAIRQDMMASVEQLQRKRSDCSVPKVSTSRSSREQAEARIKVPWTERLRSRFNRAAAVFRPRANASVSSISSIAPKSKDSSSSEVASAALVASSPGASSSSLMSSVWMSEMSESSV